jgi:hypothetical protein
MKSEKNSRISHHPDFFRSVRFSIANEASKQEREVISLPKGGYAELKAAVRAREIRP